MAAPSPITYFRDAAAFRRWLEKHHARASELWVGFYKKHTGRKSITYPEALDQALCYGWIDGIVRRVDDERYTQRFTPRQPKSIWSNINIRRVGELERLGLMAAAGRAAFERRTPERSGVYLSENPAVALAPAYEKKLRAHRGAWKFFEAQPPSYRKLAQQWVMAAKREETRARRLAALIEDSAHGLRVKPLRPIGRTPATKTAAVGRSAASRPSPGGRGRAAARRRSR
jgi:uncharacterized protein YdeI (YjbR/CyaY-like superfamily)